MSVLMRKLNDKQELSEQRLHTIETEFQPAHTLDTHLRSSGKSSVYAHHCCL